MINTRELYTFLELFDEMCRNHPACKGCELSGGNCLCVGWNGGTFEELERIVLSTERWKTAREKEIAKRELKKFVERLAEELEGDAKFKGVALVIEGSGAREIRIELGGVD